MDLGLNTSFRRILNWARQPKPILNHSQRVTRLYRQSLKLTFSWTMDRDIFLDQADKLRDEFDANKNLTLPQADYYIKKGEQRMLDCYHPDRYVIPYMPGGSKFMRNSPPPMDVVFQGQEIPEEFTKGVHTPVHVDMVPITFRPKIPERLVVDFSKKNHE